jgi:hypothetical protein
MYDGEPSDRTIRNRANGNFFRLKLLEAALFVNVAVTLALLTDLDERGNGENEDGVDAYAC